MVVFSTGQEFGVRLYPGFGMNAGKGQHAQQLGEQRYLALIKSNDYSFCKEEWMGFPSEPIKQ